MAKVNPYLSFLGNTEEVFNFYKSVFGGEFTAVMRYGDMVGQEGCEDMPDEHKQKIMHMSLPLSDGHFLMGNDAVGEYANDAVFGNNFSIAVAPDSKEEAEKIFNGLAEGGQVTMPLSDTFWGAYFGMLKDKYDIQWLVNYEYPKEEN